MGNCDSKYDSKTEERLMGCGRGNVTNMEGHKRRDLRVSFKKNTPVTTFISDELVGPMRKTQPIGEVCVRQWVSEGTSPHTTRSCSNIYLPRKGFLPRPRGIDTESLMQEAVKTKKSSTGRDVLPSIFKTSLENIFLTTPRAGNSLPSWLKEVSASTVRTSLYSPESNICANQEDESQMSDFDDSYCSGEFLLTPLKGFDGLDKRSTNRYDIGLDILKAQVANGADPKRMRTHGDRTCLMFSVLAEDFRFTKELVEQHGVDVNQTNPAGETPLAFAIELKRDDIATYLRTKGALDAHK